MAFLIRAETSQSGMLSLLRFLNGEGQHKGRLSPTLFLEALRKVGYEMLNTGDAAREARAYLSLYSQPSDIQALVKRAPSPMSLPTALALLTPTSATSQLLLVLEGAGMNTPTLSFKCLEETAMWGGAGNQ